MRTIFKLTKKINKLIYRRRFEKTYYLKAVPGTWQKTKISSWKPAFSLPRIKPSLVPAIFGLIIIASLGFLLIKNNPLSPKAKASNLMLYPAPASSNFLYQNTTNGFKVYLGNRLEETKPRIKFEQDNSSAEFSLAQFSNQGTQFEKDSNSTIIYRNIYPGVDIKYYLTEKGIKEEIVLKDKTKNNNFVFNLNLKNAIPKKSLENKTSGFFIDPNSQKYVFHIPQPFMIDSVGNRTEAVEMKIDHQSIINNDGSQTLYTITLIPNQKWLQKAVYPVTIDPSVVHDESSEFTGTTNRIEDEGSGTNPKLRTPYHELPADEHTVGLWHMNETVNDSCSGGEDACDSSGNDLDGTATGTTIETSNQKLGAAARDFNGSSDYVSVSNNSLLNPDDGIITVCLWFNADTLPSSGDVELLSKWATGGYLIYFDGDDGHLYFAVRDSGDSRKDAGISFTETNSWHHVCGVNDGVVLKIYLDGKETIGEAISGHTTNSESLYIGAYDGSSNYFDGTIDEIRLSDIARTPEEIKQNAQRFLYGVYTSDTIDLTSGVGTVDDIDSIEWTDNVSTPGATLDGYPYFKPVIIDNTQNSNTLTDYQVKVDVDYDSNMQSDFDDLRFTSHTATVSAYGSEVNFNDVNTSDSVLAALDSTHFVVGYKDSGGDAYGHAKIGTVSGDTISYGNEYTFNEATTTFISLAVLDSTHFVVAYRDDGSSTYGCAKVGTISGTTIAYGNEYCFNEVSTTIISTAVLNSSNFAVAYWDTSETACAKVGTVSGTTISFGSEACFGTFVWYTSLTALDSTHFVVTYDDKWGDTYGHARIGTVSGTTISYGTESTFNSAATQHISANALNSTHFVVAYWDDDSNDYGCTKVGTVSGTTISYGTENCFNQTWSDFISTAVIDSSHFIVGYRDEGGSNFGCVKVGTVSGTTISYGTESCFNEASSYPNKYEDWIAVLDSTHFVVGYKDFADSNKGNSVAGTITGTSLDYWIEEKSDGVEAEVWVEVDTIPANSLTTIWMWYGNAGAGAGSSGDNTFLFFDDFTGSNGNPLDSGKWNSDAVNTVTADIQNNKYRITDGTKNGSTYWIYDDTDTGSQDQAIYTLPSSFIVEWESTADDTVASYMGQGGLALVDSSNQVEAYLYHDDNQNSNINFRRSWLYNTSQTAESAVAPETKTFKIVRNSSTAEFYIDDILKGTGTMTGTPTKLGITVGAYGGSSYLDYVDFDDARVRKYTSPEPTVGVGADIEFQTRTSSDGSTWEAWKPTSNETQIDSMDSVSWKPDEPITSEVCNEFSNFSGANNTDISTINGQRYFFTHYSGPSTQYGNGTSNNFLACDGSGNTPFNSASTNYIANDVLDSDYGVVSYQDTGNSSQGTARIGSFSAGEGVTFPGSEYVFNNVATNYTSVAALDSTHFAVGYEDDGGSDYGCSKIGTTSSGTTISYGSEYCFNNAATQYVDFTMLDSTHFVAAYQDDGGSDYGCAKIGTVSGSTITYGSEYCFNSASTAYISVDALDSTHFVVAYQDTGNSSKGTAIIGTYTGSAISYGSEYVFNDATTDYPSVSTFDSSRFVITYQDEGNSSYGTAIGGTIEFNSSITFTDEHVFFSNTAYYPSVAAMDNGSAYSVGYRQNDNDIYIETGYINFNRGLVHRQAESAIKMEGSASQIATVGAQLADNDTRGLWHLEETGGTGSYFQDETSLSNDLSLNSAPAVTDGIFGKARDFDGTDDYLTCTDANCGGTTKLDYPGSGGWSVGAWVKLDTLANGGDQKIINKHYWNSSTDNGGYVLKLQDGDDKFDFFLQNSSGTAISEDAETITTLYANQWYHVVGVYDGSNVSIFLNGKLEAVDGYDGSIKDVSQDFRIGDDSGSTGTPLNGTVDEPFVTATALNSDEIAEMYRAGRDHRLQKTISSTDLSGKTKVPFYFAADKQGTIAETYVGETDHAVYGVDSNTSALWHLDDNPDDYEGYNSPGTVVDDASVGTKTWNNPSNAKATDNSDAYAATTLGEMFGNYYSHYLKATDFGFNIPSDAKIMGIRVGIERSANYNNSGNYVDDSEIKIVKGGEIGSTNKASGTNWPTTDAYASYGGSSDLWGEAWTAADVNASNFGVVLQARLYDSQMAYQTLAYVDHMRIDVWYAPIKDESGNGNMAKSRSGAAFTSQGKIGGARYFDGTNDYIEVADNSSLDITSALTVEYWVMLYGTNTNDYGGVAKYANMTGLTNQRAYELVFMANSTKPEAWISDDGTTGSGHYNTLTANTALNTNQWYHLAMVYNPSTHLRIYINGNLDAENTTSIISSLNNSSAPLWIGVNYDNLSSTRFMNGIIDEVRVSNTNRSADEIRQAYQYGLRTHQINVDFKASLDSGNLITGSGDTSFTVDATAYGLEGKGDALYIYDKIIVKENYNGTTYIAQGDVTAVNTSTGAVTVDAWDTGSTFPSGGYTANATVFKWQREYWDLGDISPNDRNATTKLGLRILDANEGFTMYIDDIRSNTNYLTDNLGATVTSTPNRYIQYRAFLSTNNTVVTPELTSVTLDYSLTPDFPTDCILDDGSQPGQVTIEWSDNSDNETGYDIDRSVDGGDYSDLTTEAADSTSYVDSTTSANHTYQYRIRATGDVASSDWCITTKVDFSEGSFKFEGLRLEGLKID